MKLSSELSESGWGAFSVQERRVAHVSVHREKRMNVANQAQVEEIKQKRAFWRR